MLKLRNPLENAGAPALIERMRSGNTLHVHHHHRAPPAPPGKNPENLFIVKCPSGLNALRYWLQKRKYNTFIHTFDKHGKPLFGLKWDYHFGRSVSVNQKERGAVLCLDQSFEKDVALIILNGLATEHEYDQQWKHAQIQLWKYGKQ